jgi:predicted metal-dependent enzyme (double-stranded beta helix superfamily)
MTKMDSETHRHAGDDEVITPFPGHPAANLNNGEISVGDYGLQPGATALMAELARTMHAALERCQPHALSAAAKASLRGYLCEPELLAAEHKKASRKSYRRHLLYAAPDRSFSILSIVWNPGQCTPVHGHTAWGAAGVYEGTPYCESFKLSESSPRVMSLQSTLTLRLKATDIATVEPGIDDAHRIGNDTLYRAVTVHIYGRDLLRSPGSINIDLDHL